MRMDAARSCELDQLALLQIGHGFPDIGGQRRGISVVFFGQLVHDLAQCSAIAAGENFLRGFVQFDDALREKQYVFTRGGIGL